MVLSKKKVAKNEDLFKKPFFYGGLAYIITIFFTLSLNVLHRFIPGFTYILMVVLIVAGFFSFYAFYVLGKRYDSKFLRVLSVILFIFLIVTELFLTLGPIVFKGSLVEIDQIATNYNQTLTNLAANSSLTDAAKQEVLSNLVRDITPIAMPFILVLLFLFLGYTVLTILFGVVLIKLGSQVPYSKAAGIVNIVGVCTLIFFVGLFILIAAWILEIMILFDQAKKFEENES